MPKTFPASPVPFRPPRARRSALLSPELSRTAGFTLLEMLLVALLLGIVATAALLSLDGLRSSAQDDATRFEMAQLREALRQFRRDVGHFPDAAGNYAGADLPRRLTLLAACQDSDPAAAAAPFHDTGCSTWSRDLRRGWNGPYLNEASPLDGWGRPYLLLDPDDDTASDDSDGVARLVSLGEDGLDGAGGVTNEASASCQPMAGSDDLVLCLLQ